MKDKRKDYVTVDKTLEYRRSGFFHCQNIFISTKKNENLLHEIIFMLNNKMHEFLIPVYHHVHVSPRGSGVTCLSCDT